jgi:hypothetical protein
MATEGLKKIGIVSFHLIRDFSLFTYIKKPEKFLFRLI